MIDYLPNIGYAHRFLSAEELALVNYDFDVSQLHNRYLAGNLAKQYLLTGQKQLEVIESIVMPLVQEMEEKFHYSVRVNPFNRDGELFLNEAWVNIQERGEFNPSHTHRGVYSFVLFIQIPFDREDELKSNVEPTRNKAGQFEFTYSSILGETITHHIPIDCHCNGLVFLFPSALSHGVYPFFSSEKQRITISGNIKLR